MTTDDGTMSPDDSTEPATVDCAACGLTVQPGDRDGVAVCPDCGAELAVESAQSQVVDPDSAEEYTGDDMRSLHVDERREIVRQVEFHSTGDDDGLTIEGYAAVFDDPTMIRDQHGDYRETIARGAFAKTLTERKPALLFDHGQHPMIGTMPIGHITAVREDAKGLYIRGRLSDNWLVQPVRDALASGAVHGMSFRADVKRDDWHPNLADRTVERSVKELALKELGPVVFPAYENTSVSVRSAAIAAELADPDTRAEVARAVIRNADAPSVTAHPSFEMIRSRARAALALSE